jgi:aldose 1-epimerase
VIEHKWFGVTAEGRHIRVFTLTNPSGMEVRLTEYGGIIVSIKVPDRHGAMANVVHGFPTLPAYVNDTEYVGAVVGRYANRIADGGFTLLGRRYELARNMGTSHLHGGVRGFNKVAWQAEVFQESDSVGATLRYDSPGGEEGYPGTLAVRVRYTLTDDDALECDMHATTDEPTHVNLTQHSYFNLSGSDDPRGILDHVLSLNAQRFLPVDARVVPTGEMRDVKGTPFDFTTPTPIGLRIDANDEQLRLGNGYDHNWIVDRAGEGLVQAATLHDPASGRTLELLTTQPGIQFYSGNWLRSRPPRSALALEPQHFPDTPNQPGFPTTLLSPGEPYHARIVYRFTATRLP